MTTNFTAVEKTYWVAFNDEGVVHKGELEPGQSVSTGLEHFESFTRRRPWLARLVALGAPLGQV